MKIQVVSDLHLDFGYQELPGGEVLILAGDIAEARNISKQHHSTKSVDRIPGMFPCSDFFEYECAKYDQVFYVMGNHEHYKGRFDKTQEILTSIIPKNVTLLEKDCKEYKGVLFLGATLWTDCNRGDWATCYQLKQGMSDYHVIQNCYGLDQHYQTRYGKLIPEFTAGVHRKTVEYFKIILEQNRDTPVVVITHHAPSFMSVNPKYKDNTLMNGGYASELGEFILDNENINLWCHGHMHDPVEYMIGKTRIVANPRGYVGHEDVSNFNPNFEIEL